MYVSYGEAMIQKLTLIQGIVTSTPVWYLLPRKYSNVTHKTPISTNYWEKGNEFPITTLTVVGGMLPLMANYLFCAVKIKLDSSFVCSKLVLEGDV